jgi:hypothetical protein
MVRGERRSRSPEYAAPLAEHAMAGYRHRSFTPCMTCPDHQRSVPLPGPVAESCSVARLWPTTTATFIWPRAGSTTSSPPRDRVRFATWSHRHHLRGDNKNPRQFPFVVASTSPADSQVALRHWDADTGAVVSSLTPAGTRGLRAREPAREGQDLGRPCCRVQGFCLTALNRVRGRRAWRLSRSQRLGLVTGPRRKHDGTCSLAIRQQARPDMEPASTTAP